MRLFLEALASITEYPYMHHSWTPSGTGDVRYFSSVIRFVAVYPLTLTMRHRYMPLRYCCHHFLRVERGTPHTSQALFLMSARPSEKTLLECYLSTLCTQEQPMKRLHIPYP